MDMPAIITQMAMLFILLAIGYLAGKVKILTHEGSKILTKVVLFITMPCMIISSVVNGNVEGTLGDAMFFILLTFLAFAIAHVVAIPICRALGGNKADHGMYSYVAAYGNVGFMGFPVAYAIFGAESVFYVALVNMPFVLLAFSIGILMVSSKGDRITLKFFGKLLLNPSIVAAVIAIVIFATGVNTPVVIGETVRVMGSMTTPASMLVIGASLAQIKVKDVFTDWRLYPVTVIKLAIIPALVWLVLRQIVTDDLILGVLVIVSAMPTAAAAAMLAMQYDGNERIASSGTFITTLLSCATVPLIVFLLLM